MIPRFTWSRVWGGGGGGSFVRPQQTRAFESFRYVCARLRHIHLFICFLFVNCERCFLFVFSFSSLVGWVRKVAKSKNKTTQ